LDSPSSLCLYLKSPPEIGGSPLSQTLKIPSRCRRTRPSWMDKVAAAVRANQGTPRGRSPPPLPTARRARGEPSWPGSPPPPPDPSPSSRTARRLPAPKAPTELRHRAGAAPPPLRRLAIAAPPLPRPARTSLRPVSCSSTPVPSPASSTLLRPPPSPVPAKSPASASGSVQI